MLIAVSILGYHSYLSINDRLRKIESKLLLLNSESLNIKINEIKNRT